MIKHIFSHSVRFVVVLLFVCTIGIPNSTSAATVKPTCELEVTTTDGTVTIKNESESISVRKGTLLQIKWDSDHATKARDKEGDRLALSGTVTSTPVKSTKYTYQFNAGSKKVICEVMIQVVSGSINASSLTGSSRTPTLSGKATGAKFVHVTIYKKDTTKIITSKNSVKVKSGSWKTKITKKLPFGEYDIVVMDGNRTLPATIATGTLVVGTIPKKDEKSQTTLVVSSVPLLIGGTAHQGGTVSVSYLQLINIGTATATVKGFSLKQNGSASTDAVVGLTVVDGNGESRGSASDADDSLVFKDGVATIPTVSVIAPKQMRLYTLKAVLGGNVLPYLGKQLKFDVTAVTTTAALKGTFPIRGTTWTIAY